MKVAKFSTLLLLVVLSSCLVLAITYQLSYKTAEQVLVSLVIKPRVPNTVVDINPDTLNLKSNGRWITAHIELPEGYDVNDIDVSTVMLNETIPVSLLDVPAPHPVPTEIGDYDSDGIPDLMVKFDRAEVIYLICSNIPITTKFTTVTLTVSGQLNNDTFFEGSDTIKVIMSSSGACGSLHR